MDNHDLIKELGSGSFGRVVKAKPKSDPSQTLAIKCIKMSNLSEKEKDGALNEIRLLASITSPTVITYHDAFYEAQANYLCIVMEFADGGDLAVRIDRGRA